MTHDRDCPAGQPCCNDSAQGDWCACSIHRDDPACTCGATP